MAVDLSDYVPVAERIAKLRADHPDAVLQTIGYEIREIAGETILILCAACFYGPDDRLPGIAFASEPFPGKTPYTRVRNYERRDVGVGTGDRRETRGGYDEDGRVSRRGRGATRRRRRASADRVRRTDTQTGTLDRGTRAPGRRRDPVANPDRSASHNATSVRVDRRVGISPARNASSGTGRDIPRRSRHRRP